MSRWLKIWLGLVIVAVVTIGVALTARVGLQASIRRSDAITSPPGIEWSGYVNINGVPQWLLIRGEDAHNPLLLFLHGGPGSPESMLAGRRYSEEIEKHFVVVHWEQRGTCKSYSRALEKTYLTLEQVVSDTDAVTRYLLATFGRRKLYLVGHSWGSLLGVLAITGHPERYEAFIGLGQVVNIIAQERISMRFTLDYLRKSGDEAGLAKLMALGDPPYARPFEDLMQQRRVLLRAGGSFGPRYPVRQLLRDGLLSPHYELLDAWRLVKGEAYSVRGALGQKEYWDLALDRTHTRFSIPVCFFIGHRDYNTPFELVEDYYDRIEAPKKGKVIFENAAHMIPFEEPERFNREVVRVFTSEAYAQR